MNYQLAIVGGLTALALFAHLFGGIRELLSVEPAKLTNKEKLANFETLDRNWVLSMCAFQLVTIDLLALTALLFFLAFTDVLYTSSSLVLRSPGFIFCGVVRGLCSSLP